MATLDEAVEAFLKKERKVGGTLTSTAASLLSYGQCVGEWIGDVVVLRYEGRDSRTSKRHRNMLRRMATSRGIAVREGGHDIPAGIERKFN